jgi:hypothetical protein
MPLKRYFVCLGVVCLVLTASVSSWAQASINESLETAFYWVDAVNGNDNNPGTQQQPFQTIGKGASVAVANKQLGIGSKVTINPGTYREAVVLPDTANNTTLPITFEAATTGTAILSGADVSAGWTTYSGNSNIFTNVWPNQWGLCSADTGGGPFEQDIVLRREMIIVNGTPLSQVLSLAQMQQGTFFVDDTGGTAYIWPSNGTNISTATVEVANRPELINIQTQNNIVLRGLTFQYANSCRTDSALLVTSSNEILIDNDAFYWNNAQALGMASDTLFTVQNSTANHNGQTGFGGFQDTFSLWTNNVVDYNNWRGAQGAYYLWSSAGIHPFEMHNGTFVANTVAFNQTYGIHWDTDNFNITDDQMILAENLIAEGFVEKSEGPLAITNSYMCNGNPSTGPNSVGFDSRNSELLTLSNNVIYNDVNEILVNGTAGGIQITNWETGQTYNLVTQNMVNTNNTIVGTANEAVFYDGTLNGSDWTSFDTTFISNSNTWWNADFTTPFTVPVPNQFTELNFAGWQAATGQDLLSSFAAPANGFANACQLTPGATDFWLVQNALTTLIPITKGQSAQFTVSAVPFNFSGPITLTADGVQNIAGGSSSWDTTTINTSGSATLTVNTGTTTAPGVYPITMIANNGAITRTSVGSVLVNTTVAIDPLVLNFGSVNVGAPSSVMTATMVNAGTAAITITSITTTGDYSQTNTCGTSLAVGSSCSITVTFTPKAVGTRTGTLTIKDSDTTGQQKVTLTGVGLGIPIVTLTPTSLSFPDTTVGISSTPLKVTLKNSGSATLSIASITFTGINITDFSQTNTCGSSVGIGVTCTISVTFTPQNSGARSASMLLTDNASPTTQTVTLSGNGLSASVSVSPTSLNFGNQQVGVGSTAQVVTMTNTGTGAVLISSITLGGTNPGDYSETSTCPISPKTLGAGANCTVNVTFKPTTTGLRSATLSFTDNALNSPQSVNLVGTGVSPTVKLTPTSMNFGNVAVGTSSSSKAATLQNIGSVNVSITSVSITGTNPGDYSDTSTCGATLAPGASCTINVTFKPTTTGTRNATLQVTDNATGSPQQVTLTGVGVSGSLTLTPSTLTFSTQLINTSSKSQKITVKNTGTGSLTLNSITITGTNAGDYSQTNTCATTINPGASCQVTVTFTPTASGTRTASVSVSYNGTGSPATASLTGTGTVVSLSPAILNFPATTVGHSSNPKSVTVTNVSTTSISMTGINFTGTNPGDFSQTNTCGSSVAGGGSCTITVTFTPTATGSRSATLNVNDTGGGSPQTVALTGTGQ